MTIRELTEGGLGSGGRRSWLGMLSVVLTLFFGFGSAVTGCGVVDDVGSYPNDDGRIRVVDAGSALATLAAIPVRPEIRSPRYERDEFGSPWEDVDGNGCDTRNDILRRDLRSVTVKRQSSCIVLTGELPDPYTNRTIRFDRARAAPAVQIDHVVALADAWRTGAAFWAREKRVAFANDPENLLAVDGPTNEEKSDDTADEWLPPNQGYRCRYVARQIGVKARYGLWVQAAEREAMIKVLGKCPAQATLGGPGVS